MSAPVWVPLVRNYEKEAQKYRAPMEASTSHPLLLNKPKSSVTMMEKPVGGSAKSPKGIKSPLDSDPLSDPLSSGGFIDPLSASSSSAAAVSPLDDPLSSTYRGGTAVETRSQAVETAKQVVADLHIDPWQIKKQQIRKEYSITGNVVLSSSALNEFSGSGVEDGSGTKRVDKYDKRLANLERREMSADERVELSQKEYENHVEKLFRDLQSAWNREERVLTLKIAIQIAKLLADTTLPQFYPSIFVIVTDALDRFGAMVYKRLLAKAEEGLNSAHPNAKQKLKLSPDFTAADVPSTAKETCRNWFYKTACIRELLPRIFVEIALLRCYRFVTDTDYAIIFQRIGSVIRGLGDPLVAFYARLYLVVAAGDMAGHINANPNNPANKTNNSDLHHNSSSVHPQHNLIALPMLQDALFSLSMARDSPLLAAELERKKISPRAYFFLLSPAVEWMLKTVGRGASRDSFTNVLQLFRDTCNDTMVLKHIIEAFDATHYAHASMGMVTLAKNATVSCVGILEVLQALGKQLAIHPPPEDMKLPLLNEVWKIVTKEMTTHASSSGNTAIPSAQLLASFVGVTAAWLDCVQRHYSEREMLVLLGSLAQRVSSSLSPPASAGSTSAPTTTTSTTLLQELPESVQVQLETLLTSLINQSATFGTAVLTSEHLLTLLDVFKGTRKVQLCRDILESLKAPQDAAGATGTGQMSRDPVLINTLFDLARIVHDAVDGLAAFDDVSYTAGLLVGFVTRMDFGRDLEQQLNFYVECRAAFPNFDAVKEVCVLGVVRLAQRTHAYVKGKHSKKTTVFVKACLAYCHITIPSLQDYVKRLELLLLCAQVSLLNACLPQTDTFLKAAISLLPELHPQNLQLVSATSNSNSNNMNHAQLLQVYSGAFQAHPQALPNNYYFHPASSIPAVTSTSSYASMSVSGILGQQQGSVGVAERISELLLQLLGFLVLVPGHPEHGPFYVIQGLLNALPVCPAWTPLNLNGDASATNDTFSYAHSAALLRVYVHIVALLCSLRQPRLPYHIHQVQSNDELYGNTPAYDAALQDLLTQTIGDILVQLTKLGEKADSLSTVAGQQQNSVVAKGLQARVALDLCNVLMAHIDIAPRVGAGAASTNTATLQFLLKLLDLAQKARVSPPSSSAKVVGDVRYLQNTIASLQRRLLAHKRSDSVQVEDEEVLSVEVVDVALKKLQELLVK